MGLNERESDFSKGFGDAKGFNLPLSQEFKIGRFLGVLYFLPSAIKEGYSS